MAKVVFDGKKEAERMALFLEESERVLGKSLMIFQCDGLSSESSYVRLKREMGERLGVMVMVQFPKDKEELKKLLKEANGDDTIDGILVQLPILGADRGEVEQILSTINPLKDVDGLNPKSSFIPAAIRAVERLIEIFKVSEDDRVAVVGAEGTVGARLIQRLKDLNIPAEGYDKGDSLEELKKFDVIISVTGAQGLIRSTMVSQGYMGIDLGFPKGDFSSEAVEKASLITPVPGGVGPMTIVALYENLADSVLV
ncbi:MAG: Bifunctional protein FolD [Candidatus Collierbacteria bacterium GW2011_GWB1_44_6]|uniref:Bifunctional protein FolD n=1 Tax=Candidatus Collierbacteria bacterium GW2011_GWB1_44_6 TaxID=1618384 RepID=A0A0G1JKI0_9BACT|nr:MAG: Bifunctional protein FolD [Candidatus Collierbacteria bacterium GW2011_GWB1_44_6]KKT82464.1 MAG: methylenetetrahydrofolate dehydrogenase/methenyltetrahydrofolate cyclohydrolase [Microgenomates group bacterium GW2011_GWC1_44_9]